MKMKFLGKAVLIVLFCFVCLNFSLAQSQPELEWVVRYNGPEGLSDDIKGMVVDTQGNTYVTGNSKSNVTNYDILTIKYDTEGNLLWSARYNGPENRLDQACDIKVDGLGNVYVAGFSNVAPDSYANDIVIIKYDSNGIELWVSQYSGPAGPNGYDFPRALTLDSSGNVYITGTSRILYGQACCTLKYDTNGNLIWDAIYEDPENDSEWNVGNGIALDLLGNVIVTGSSRERHGEKFAFLTLKYNSAGAEQWAVRYSGKEKLDSGAYFIVCDEVGNIFIAGPSGTALTSDSDIVLVKYDSEGNELWDQWYSGTYYRNDTPTGLALDSSGCAYLSGSVSNEGTGYDATVIKYDPSGSLEWASGYNSGEGQSDYANSIVVDSNNMVYIIGDTRGESGTLDFLIIKYDADGNLHWEETFDSASSWMDLPIEIEIGPTNDVYIGGFSGVRFDKMDYLIVKYRQTVDPIVQVTNIIENIEELVQLGSLDQNNAFPLISSLQQAKKNISKQKYGTACNQLGAFINQVNALINSGRLTLEQGQELIDTAQGVIDQLLED